MTTHRRIRSGRSHSHIVVSIALDNHTIHLTGTVHSRTGGPLVITDGSTELQIDQLLQSVPDITLRYGLNRSETSCSFVWSDSTVAPDQVEWVGLRATVWRIYEQGESMESYSQREILLLGMVTDVLIESGGDIVSLSIQCDPLLDYGDLYGADDELGPTEFPDMDGVSAGQPRSRAYRAKALLPPIPICRAGGPLESPVMVVQDEQAPVGSTPLDPRRYLVSREPLANKSVTRNLRVVKPNQDNQVFRPDTLFQSSLTDGVGSTGRAYTYLAGDLSVNFGTTLTAWSNGSTTVSAPAQGGRVGVGDVVKAIGHAGTAWAEVASVDGTAITLVNGYQGASTTAQGEVILLPADTAYPAYILVGGASGDGGGVAWGTDPLHTAADVVGWAMRRAVSAIPVDHWRSTSLRSVSSSYSVSTVINERVAPTAWINDMIVSWCPLDLTVSDGHIEPRWSTAVLGGTRLDRSESTVTQLNVYDPTIQSDPYWTSDPSVVRLEPVRIEGVYQTAWTAQYAWSVRSGRYESVVSVPRCGRVLQLEQVSRRQHRRDGVSRSSQVNRVELSAVGETDVALRSLLHRLRIEGVPDCTVRISVAPHLAWLRCGDFVSLSDPSLPTAIQSDQLWRVDEMVLSDQMTILLRLIRQ